MNPSIDSGVVERRPVSRSVLICKALVCQGWIAGVDCLDIHFHSKLLPRC